PPAVVAFREPAMRRYGRQAPLATSAEPQYRKTDVPGGSCRARLPPHHHPLAFVRFLRRRMDCHWRAPPGNPSGWTDFGLSPTGLEEILPGFDQQGGPDAAGDNWTYPSIYHYDQVGKSRAVTGVHSAHLQPARSTLRE